MDSNLQVITVDVCTVELLENRWWPRLNKRRMWVTGLIYLYAWWCLLDAGMSTCLHRYIARTHCCAIWLVKQLMAMPA